MPLEAIETEQVFVEDWGAGYGSPYLIDVDVDGSDVPGKLVEDGDALEMHPGVDSDAFATLAFVDGIRRADAWLYRIGPDGSTARGVAGAHATGAVLAAAGQTPNFTREHVQRLIVWGSGARLALPEIFGGWRWDITSVAATDPDAPLLSLQDRMREAERTLALELADVGHLVVLDGPLNFVVGRNARVVGYVKTHHRAFLPPEQHGLVPRLGLGERTSIFAIEDRYSCYARIGARGRYAGPWSGVVRLHFSGENGLDGAKYLADVLTARLPKYAGVAHCDPRAPQNLQPIGALESHLRHLMGDSRLATRAVRDAASMRIPA
jgi:hypothetical protein